MSGEKEHEKKKVMRVLNSKVARKEGSG